MTIDFGYGVDMSRARMKPDAAKYVFEHYATDDLRDDFKEFCEDNPEIVEDGTAVEVFVEEFEDDITCASGIEGFLVKCINDAECKKYSDFIYDDYCIYVGARIPANQTQKASMLTMEDIHKILAKYLNPILETELVVEYVEINN